ncbi:MAG: AI-2E family transporter [Rickettsiales bacterium]|nr:AI-2E family transporter [Rickettsiales bacterium]
MKLKEKIIAAILIALVLGSLIYLVGSTLIPFIFAIVIAYFLNPLVGKFCRKYRINRTFATSLILGLFLVFLISFGLLVFPIIYLQTVDFINSVPDYFKIFVSDFYPKICITLNKFGFTFDSDFSRLLEKEQITTKFLTFFKDFISNAISSSSTIIDILSLIFIMPILLFYFLKDWEIMLTKINSFIPKNGEDQIRKIFSEIDKTMSGYIRGQFNVCLILGIIYAALLSIAGLNFGFLIGFLTGMLVFIPYVGMLIGVTCGIIVALFQWGFDFANIGLIAIIFLIGQTIESNFLTPKLVGSRIGLHPLWLIFGLFFFGACFGFFGVLLAVPLTAISGVIIKNLAMQYKKRFV